MVTILKKGFKFLVFLLLVSVMFVMSGDSVDAGWDCWALAHDEDWSDCPSPYTYDHSDGSCCVEKEGGADDPSCLPHMLISDCDVLDCGQYDDGCGNIINCGWCPSGETCSSGTCVSDCVPQDCSDLGVECGSTIDNCGDSRDCGSCPSGESCSGGVCGDSSVIIGGVANDCMLKPRDFTDSDYQLTGYVSMQGHYSNELGGNVQYPYGLFCDAGLIIDREDGVASFNFSNPQQEVLPSIYGSGMSTFTGENVDFEGEAKQGFTTCEVKDTCTTDEVCVVKISDEDVGVIADCNDDNTPYEHSFENKICCEATEYCRDGIDNTGDGLIDCASPDCHPSPETLDIPQLCTGNNQNTTECITGVDSNDNTIYNQTCLDDNNDAYYCSYGEGDDGSQTSGEGYCCPAGERARQNPVTGVWECAEFTQCGLGTGYDCNFDFRTEQNNWFNQIYDGDQTDWCVSQLPNLYHPSGSEDSSMACCFTQHYGKYDFYYKDENVKIYGVK